MMSVPKTNVNVCIDTNIKERAAQILERMGIDQTTAIDMFFRQVIKETGLPFKQPEKPALDEQLTQAVRKSKPKKIEVEFDENGNILVDKDSALYDWAVNG